MPEVCSRRDTVHFFRTSYWMNSLFRGGLLQQEQELKIDDERIRGVRPCPLARTLLSIHRILITNPAATTSTTTTTRTTILVVVALSCSLFFFAALVVDSFLLQHLFSKYCSSSSSGRIVEVLQEVLVLVVLFPSWC